MSRRRVADDARVRRDGSRAGSIDHREPHCDVLTEPSYSRDNRRRKRRRRRRARPRPAGADIRWPATGRMSVAAAAGVSARSASAARTVAFDQIPRRRDFAADVHARRIGRIDDGGQAQAEIAGGRLDRRDGFGVARPRPRDQVLDAEGALFDLRGPGRLRRRGRNTARASRGWRRTLPSTRSIRTSSADHRARAAHGRIRRRCCALPRSSSPWIMTPTPTPSDTLTNTRSPGRRPPRRAWPRPARARRRDRSSRSAPASPVAAASGSRRFTLRQPSVGACRICIVDSLDHAGHDDADAFDRPDVRVFGAQRLDPLGERGDKRLRIARGPDLTTPLTGLPSRSVSRTNVLLARTSTATTARRRESMYRNVGLRPRIVSPVAPSTTSLCFRRSLTMRVTTPRRTPMVRARSAREIG